MSVAEVISSATEVLGTAINQTSTIVTALPFFLLPMGFVFAKKFIGLAKSLTMQSKGRRR